MIQREHSLLQHIQTIFESGTVSELTDAQLVERFAGPDRETAELCFAALIKRHGPMVFRTCQAIVHDAHDAEDAFQAAFLVLARKARSLVIRDSLGPWLYEVACLIAAGARSARAQRRNHEREAAAMGAPTRHDKTWDDSGAVLREELQHLPDRYRTAIVLCDLEGLTQERAAQLLGWPAGTVRSRLARGRERLRDRLTRRGLTPAVVPALPWLTGDAPTTAVSVPLAEITTDAAVRVGANRAALGAMATVGSLTEGALRAMFWNKLKLMAAGILACGLFAGTAVLAFYSAGLEQGRSPARKAEEPARDGAGVIASSDAQSPAAAPSLIANAKAQLDVAKKLRRWMYKRTRIDPSQDFRTEFLRCQNRYYDVAQEVLVKTDADLVRFLEHRLAMLKRTEKYVKDLDRGTAVSSGDAFAAELDRLEAEDRLEKAKAKVSAGGAAPAGTVSSDLLQFLNQDTWAPDSSGTQGAGPSHKN
jgi:RNA polymerase sigma factor (sigma-70 family)